MNSKKNKQRPEANSERAESKGLSCSDKEVSDVLQEFLNYIDQCRNVFFHLHFLQIPIHGEDPAVVYLPARLLLVLTDKRSCTDLYNSGIPELYRSVQERLSVSTRSSRAGR